MKPPVIAFGVVAVLSASVLAGPAMAATGRPSNAAPSASEIGVTPTEIHIAVMADVDNPFVPNIMIGARNGVQGFARYINASCANKNRCLAGRKLVVDF
jgi:hypothetical protein